MVKTTKEQRKALFRLFQRDFPSWLTPTTRQSKDEVVKVPSFQYRRFRAKVVGAFGGDCVMIPWANMWIGIERDGYTHS